jgi:hypothetical protein
VPTRKGWRFTLATAGPGAPYRRKSLHERRKADGSFYYPTIAGAVCWHGHRDFFRALYALAPDAEIRTGKATYRGRDHFERTHRDTFGAPYNYYGYSIQAYGDACVCEEG